MAESSEKNAMATTSLDQSLQGTLAIDINAAARTLKMWWCRTRPFCCSRVILKQDFLKHQNFKTGEVERPLTIPLASWL